MKKWKKRNKNNTTYPINCFDINCVSVGKNTYGGINFRQYNSDAQLIIGNYCSIADNCVFLGGGEHDYKRISLWPFYTYVYKDYAEPELHKSYKIEIGDDVWIGYGVTILSGSKIGTGSVIGAGSVVRGEIPPYSVYVGNKVVKKRFDDSIINKLLEIDWSKINHSHADSYKKYVTTRLNNENINEVFQAFVNH